MAIYLAGNPTDRLALAKAAERGQLRRLVTGVYTDEMETLPEELLHRHALAIVGHKFPDSYFSHSTAATHSASEDGYVFVSGPGERRRTYKLGGLTIVRSPALPVPELHTIELETQLSTTLSIPTQRARAAVSAPLQTLLECAVPARRYSQKTLHPAQLSALAASLDLQDRARINDFARRNKLSSAYEKVQPLLQPSPVQPLAKPPTYDLFFYGWCIGTLTAQPHNQFRFTYDPEWRVQIGPELPLPSRANEPSYDGLHLPPLFDHLLPEGWTESLVRASQKVASGDDLSLLTSTRKYLSNLTLRPLGIPLDELTYDMLAMPIDGTSDDTVVLHDQIRADVTGTAFWRAFSAAGGVRISGVQPKLPVSLTYTGNAYDVEIGDLRTSCTHILKFPVPHYPGLIENEYATMRLARRIGLQTASVCLGEFRHSKSLSDGRVLIVERYDIPDRERIENPFQKATVAIELPLQADACVLLGIRRGDKYRTSMERIATALLNTGIPLRSMWSFLDHVIFSWLVGNGDLHAKNVSLIWDCASNPLGGSPTLAQTRYAPLYDLVNTKMHIRDDGFALSLCGRQTKLRVSDFVELGARCGFEGDVVKERIRAIYDKVMIHLDDVLDRSYMTIEMQERYRNVVKQQAKSL